MERSVLATTCERGLAEYLFFLQMVADVINQRQ